MKEILLSLCVLTLLAPQALAAAPPPLAPPTLVGADKVTLQKLHDGDQMAGQMGKLAQDKGSTRGAREFGRTLAADASGAERNLGAFLRKRGSDLTALGSSTSADPDHELLATKTGPDFDRAFAQQMVRDEQKTLELLNSARVETADDGLRLLYDGCIQTANAHKRAAQDLLSSLARG